MNPLFNHQVIAASRALSKEIDDMIEAYYMLLGEGQKDNSAEQPHTIYSIDVEVSSGNWDYYSGVYFILDNGETQCSTEGSGYKSLPNGWVTFNMSNGNKECLFFEFFQSSLSVSVVHHQNSNSRDQVTIFTIQVSVDGNYLPSFELDTPHITVASGRQSDFFSLKPMNMLKAFKTRTSHLLDYDTEIEVYMKLSLGDQVMPQWLVLDNLGLDDRVRGETDIFTGTTLNKGNQMIRDYAEFYPETAEIQITLRLREAGALAHTWYTDLAHFYFSGKNGRDVVIRCLSGDKWLDNSQDVTFNCRKLEENYPARSIEMFVAHTCDITFSGSGSDRMKLKFCKKRDQFQSFISSSKNLDCCSTNYFPLGSTRNEYERYDVISRSDVLDGGEVLGECEGFDLLGTEIYVGEMIF